MLKKIDHIAIAVSSIDDALKVFGEVFGLKAEHIEEIPDQKVKAATVRIGDVNIEFIEPTDPESGVAKFVEKKGEGIHHIAVEVADIDAELKALEGKGVALIDAQARKGLAGKIGFLHPKSTKGVLMELVEKV
jgi:lactoylglutathione lyase/methylmalonyl-CoA/ethylmalonyl-CoA epimerase